MPLTPGLTEAEEKWGATDPGFKSVTCQREFQRITQGFPKKRFG
jgi:hypothetical protein